MEIVRGDHVAPGTEHLGVPSIREAVGYARVRTAMEQQIERVLLGTVEPRWVSNPHLDRLSIVPRSVLASNASLKVVNFVALPVAKSSRTNVGGSKKLSRSATTVRPLRDTARFAKLCSLVTGVAFPEAASIR